jgi:DNA invertase Pin-like site-specific DNA recombinase
MKIALYARVSDDKKKSDGERRQDVNRQVDMLRDYLKRREVKEWEEYVDDGKSAFTDDWNCRPDFRRLMNDCKRHFVTEIVMEDLTRLSRNLLNGLRYMKDLSDLRIDILSLKEGQLEVTSTKGWMQSSMLLMFAEMESRMRSEKVKSGMLKARNLGKNIGRPKNKRKVKSDPPFLPIIEAESGNG